jgi:hypothetical protein
VVAKLYPLNYRILFGTILILGGILGFLEKFGLIANASKLFWGFIIGIAGMVFFHYFLTKRAQWWWAIPAFSLVGLAGMIVMPSSLIAFRGIAFLGAVGLGFLVIYLKKRDFWWAIIPTGVFLTLGSISSLSNFTNGKESATIFFIGLGLTFLIVALIPSGSHHLYWAFIPSIILIIFGALLGFQFNSILDYVWILALFLVGFSLVLKSFRR